MDQRERIGNFQEGVRAAIDGDRATLWTALPGIVQDFDASKQTATVQIAVEFKSLNPDGSFQWIGPNPLTGVPVLFPQAGGFAITVPVEAGDEVLVMFASRCFDAWWQNGGTGIQAEFRMHDMSDGFAILAPRSLPNVLSAFSTNSCQMRTKDGSAFIELTADGKVNIKAPGGVHITGDAEISGDAVIGGDENLSGSLTAATATIGGRGFSGHEHGGVSTGSGHTGPPI